MSIKRAPHRLSKTCWLRDLKLPNVFRWKMNDSWDGVNYLLPSLLEQTTQIFEFSMLSSSSSPQSSEGYTPQSRSASWTQWITFWSLYFTICSLFPSSHTLNHRFPASQTPTLSCAFVCRVDGYIISQTAMYVGFPSFQTSQLLPADDQQIEILMYSIRPILKNVYQMSRLLPLSNISCSCPAPSKRHRYFHHQFYSLLKNYQTGLHWMSIWMNPYSVRPTARSIHPAENGNTLFKAGSPSFSTFLASPYSWKNHYVQWMCVLGINHTWAQCSNCPIP